MHVQTTITLVRQTSGHQHHSRTIMVDEKQQLGLRNFHFNNEREMHRLGDRMRLNLSTRTKLKKKTLCPWKFAMNKYNVFILCIENMDKQPAPHLENHNTSQYPKISTVQHKRPQGANILSDLYLPVSGVRTPSLQLEAPRGNTERNCSVSSFFTVWAFCSDALFWYTPIY